MISATEVFIDLKEKRNFKGNNLFFDRNNSSLEIEFNSNNSKDLESLVDIYGFNEDEKVFGIRFKTFLNNEEIFENNFSTIKKGDKIKISYIDSGCFELYFHLVVYEVNNFRDNDYYFRKELEK
jgi:hypothetical protein